MIATIATAMRARWGSSSLKSGRRRRIPPLPRSATALDDGTGDRARDGEGAAVLRDLGADLERDAPGERAVGAHVHGPVAAQHAAQKVHVAEGGALVGGPVVRAEL